MLHRTTEGAVPPVIYHNIWLMRQMKTQRPQQPPIAFGCRLTAASCLELWTRSAASRPVRRPIASAEPLANSPPLSSAVAFDRGQHRQWSAAVTGDNTTSCRRRRTSGCRDCRTSLTADSQPTLSSCRRQWIRHASRAAKSRSRWSRTALFQRLKPPHADVCASKPTWDTVARGFGN